MLHCASAGDENRDKSSGQRSSSMSSNNSAKYLQPRLLTCTHTHHQSILAIMSHLWYLHLSTYQSIITPHSTVNTQVWYYTWDCSPIHIRVVNGYSVNRLTGPEGWTAPETDGPGNRRIIYYLAITAHVYKFRFMNIAPPLIFSFRLHFCTKAVAAAWLGTSDWPVCALISLAGAALCCVCVCACGEHACL